MMLFLFNVQLRNKYDDDDDDEYKMSVGLSMGLAPPPSRQRILRGLMGIVQSKYISG